MSGSGSPRWFPRTRGDGPDAKCPGGSGEMVSPHTRGWTLVLRDGVRRQRGFPAHAGMDPRPTATRSIGSRFPRTRGDGPPSSRSTRVTVAVSPHTRGWTRRGRPADCFLGGFPAHAGMDPSSPRRQGSTWGFPRTRGDGPGVALFQRAERRVPRTRGDGPDRFPVRVDGDQVSPHTRGWTLGPLVGRHPREGFPAHAGMDPAQRRYVVRRRGFPRTRGDGPRSGRRTPGLRWVSPHTRGWTRCHRVQDIRQGGFPAHAGMDPRSSARTS